MASNNLPKGDSSDLRLVVATDKENIAQQHANSSEWRGALSLAAYLKREELLVNQDLTKGGGLTAWMLVHQPQGTKDEDRQVLCGCESIKKKALLARNGKVEDVVAHGVASVFCPEKLRGKGYAGRMMSEVGKKLEGWQAGEQGKNAFSVLYSDIGKEFYAARGWKPFPSSHIALPASADAFSGLPATEPLKAQDLGELCKLDEQLIRNRLSQLATGDKTSAALIPDVRTLDWHHAREDFIANELHSRDPTTKGAIVTHNGKRTWCIWTRVWTNPNEEASDTLHILRLASEDPAFADFEPASEASAPQQDDGLVSAIAALFAAAQKEAKEWGMEHVEIWNPASVTLAAARKVQSDAAVVHREKESIASLRWYGEGDGADVRWVCNEKFGWC